MALAALLLGTAPLVAEARLDVGGSVEVAEGGIHVQVDLRNGGDAPATAVHVEGELMERQAQAQVLGIPAGESRSIALHFPGGAPRPGVHALVLLLDYTTPGPSGPTPVSQRAYLLLALGEMAEPAVRLSVGEARMTWSGLVDVSLESADGAPHRVRLRIEGPRGFRGDNPPREVDVPALGTVTAKVRVFRGTVPWASRQGILAVGSATDGPLARTTVATGIVEILPDPAWMPRLRRPLWALALALLGLAILFEARRRLG